MPEMVPLVLGSYMSRSCMASAQRCVNLYADKNPPDAPFPYTFYPTPGLRRRWSPSAAAPARCAFVASTGDLYYVAGRNVYYVPPNFTPVKLGELSTTSTPVSMRDNGTTALIVDGTLTAFQIDLTTRVMTAYADASYLGADRVDYLDGFLLFNKPNSREFYTTLLNSTVIDPTYAALKSAATDKLACVVVVQRLAWLLGVKNSEVWGNVGAPAFPFQLIPGASVQHGLASTYSVATHDNSVFFVEANPDGGGAIARTNGYGVMKISTPAIEAELATYPTLTDAIGFIYSKMGRAFYVVTFPSADKTWAFDMAHDPPMPHEWNWTDSDGLLHRHRAAVHAAAYGMNIVGDWENGDLYQLDFFRYNDFGGQITRVRGFPHSVAGGRLSEYKQFQAEMEPGQKLHADDAGFPVDAQVTLRVSRTRGKSFEMRMLRSLGPTGDYVRVPQWRQLGRGRDMVFELEWGFDAFTALNGGYVDHDPTDA